MLERVEHDNGVVTYQSPLLRQRGVRHAFSTRIGGISKGGYARLNLGSLGKGAGDDNALISENFRRLRAAVGLQKYMRYELKQVHGCAVWCDLPPKPPRPCDVRQADAMVTDLPQRMLTVRTADCVALLLYDGRQIAAAHAGWRGVVAGVVGAVLAKMDVERVVVAIGPAIGVEYFEVGDEVAEAFVSAGLEAAVRPGNPRPHIDLPGAVLMQLQQAGVTLDRIDGCDRCTYRDEAEFFSYRRDVTHRGQVTGHMAAVIALDAADATH